MKRIFTPAKKKTVLLIDDDQLMIDAHRSMLQRCGLNVEIADADDSLSEQLAANGASLVVLDLCIPGGKSLEILRNIRATSDAAALPVIAFINPYLTNLARAATEAGASKLISKIDCTPGQLAEAVRELLAISATSSAAEVNETQAVASVLLGDAQETLSRLRVSHQTLARTGDEEVRCAELREMHRQVRSFTAAHIAGFKKISQMASAFEALLIELQAKPKKITPSVIRTVAQAIDTLPALFDEARGLRIETTANAKILVVDDEVISRETICSALEKAKLAGVSMDDSVAAQRVIEEEHFDLIFLDVEMPGLTGFELCVKIRETTMNRDTPVVFVTAHSDFASRAQSALSGGNDFITKPFLSGELAVKALASLFKKEATSSAKLREEIAIPPLAEAAPSGLRLA